MLALCGVGMGTCDGAGVRMFEVYAMARRQLCRDNTTWTVFFNGEFLPATTSTARTRLAASGHTLTS